MQAQESRDPSAHFTQRTLPDTETPFEPETGGVLPGGRMGMLVGNFEQNLFYGRGLNFSSPLRGTNIKQNIISCDIFSPQYPIRYRKINALAVDLSRLNTLRDVKTSF